MELAASGVWRDVEGLADSLSRTLADAAGISEIAAALTDPSVKRVVAVGNGASLAAATALWHASLMGPPSPFEVVAVPAGMVVRPEFAWRPGDRILAFSNSGELRDIVELTAKGDAPPLLAITGTPRSTLASRARATANVAVIDQRAETHSQGYCGAIAAALAIWARITKDDTLARELRDLPRTVDLAINHTRSTLAEIEAVEPPVHALAFGSGPASAAAMETALLFRELATIPCDAMDTREAATLAIMLVSSGFLVVPIRTAAGDTTGTERELRDLGANLFLVGDGSMADPRLASILSFPTSAALALSLALKKGLDVDRPAWTNAYYQTARRDDGLAPVPVGKSENVDGRP
jgi:fructoselysine-6-P-deglycase FrlB-like protein